MTRINDRIRAPRVRVIDGTTGEQLGVLATSEAIRRAKRKGLDLVEIAARVDPPVCKIIDYGKFKYEQSKQKKEQNKSKAGRLKEVKFRVGIDPHDYRIKLVRAEDFLFEGHKLRVQLMFKGRQMAHKELGFELMEQVRDDLKGVSQVDMEPRMSGRHISMQLSPVSPQKRKPKFISIEERTTTKRAAPTDEDHDDDDQDDDDDDDDDEGNDGDSGSDDASASASPESEPESNSKP